jgi:hypothetical protein
MAEAEIACLRRSVSRECNLHSSRQFVMKLDETAQELDRKEPDFSYGHLWRLSPLTLGRTQMISARILAAAFAAVLLATPAVAQETMMMKDGQAIAIMSNGQTMMMNMEDEMMKMAMEKAQAVDEGMIFFMEDGKMMMMEDAKMANGRMMSEEMGMTGQ